MNFKRFVIILAAAICLCSCSKISDIEILSSSVKSINNKGLKEMDVEVSLLIKNSTTELNVTDISGTLYYDGKKYASYTIDPLTAPAKSTNTCSTTIHATLAEGISILSMMKVARHFSSDEVSTDIQGRMKFDGGFAKKYHLKNVSINRFIKR